MAVGEMSDGGETGAGGAGGATPGLSGWRLWWAGARPRTLPAAIVPVLVGTAAAAGEWHGSVFDGPHGLFPPGGFPSDLAIAYGAWPEYGGGVTRGIILWRFVAALVVALAIQVATNYANDYSDGKRGTDDPGKRVGPVRLVGSGLATPGQVKKAILISFAVAGAGGLALAAAVGWWLILVGLMCFAAGWFYTGGPKPYGYAGLGEAFVFVFFGVVATTGSAFVQMERMPWLALAASVPVGCLATALLVINNLRDIPSDTLSGKRTLAVKLGDQRTRILYTVLLVLPFVLTPIIAGLSRRPAAALSLVAVLLARKPLLPVLQGAKGAALIPVLGSTGQVQLIYGVLLSVGFFVGAPQNPFGL